MQISVCHAAWARAPHPRWFGVPCVHVQSAKGASPAAARISSARVLTSAARWRAISSSSQLTHLVMDVGFTWAEARKVLLDGAKAAFLPAEEKEEMVAEFEAELDRVLVGHGVAMKVEEEEKAEAV